MEGLTGVIKLDSDGLRTDFKLDIVGKRVKIKTTLNWFLNYTKLILIFTCRTRNGWFKYSWHLE